MPRLFAKHEPNRYTLRFNNIHHTIKESTPTRLSDCLKSTSHLCHHKNMKLPHRIAAGGLIFSDKDVLLVRYPDGEAGSYLVAPGGGLEHNENVEQAIIREVLEETGLDVQPKAVVMIEDLVGSRFKMIKVWMTCTIIGGSISQTQGAMDEGITEVDWFNREQLRIETVFPSILLEKAWDVLQDFDTGVTIAASRIAGF